MLKLELTPVDVSYDPTATRQVKYTAVDWSFEVYTSPGPVTACDEKAYNTLVHSATTGSAFGVTEGSTRTLGTSSLGWSPSGAESVNFSHLGSNLTAEVTLDTIFFLDATDF